MRLRRWLVVLCLVSVAACSSSEQNPAPIEDTSSSVGDTPIDTTTPDTTSPDSGGPDDTLSPPDTQMVDSAMDATLDSGSDAETSVDASVTDTAETGGDTSVTDTGSDLGYDPCDIALPCLAATSGNVQFCGSVFDLASTTRVNGPTANVQVAVYDLFAFAGAPTTTSAIATLSVDACGRFSGAVSIPSGGVSRYLVAVDDASTADNYAKAGIAAAGPDISGRFVGLRAFAMLKTTDAAWSTSASLSPSLVTRGAYLGIFIDPNKLPVGPFSGAPVAGVQFTKSSLPLAAYDYYFSDSAALSRTSIASDASVTSANGSGLLLGQSLSDGVVFSATGGLGTGCRWPTQSAPAIPGLMLVQEFVMTSTSGMTCTGAP